MQDQIHADAEQANALGRSGHGKELCLLSLDGGGVRGMSLLFILKKLMKDIGPDPLNPPKPCEYFNMIGGTSTGGLIAIMLGRLQMSVDECIVAYRRLADDVFQAKHYAAAPWWTLPWNWELRGRFDTQALEKAIKTLVVEQLRKRPENVDETIVTDLELENTLLYESDDPSCKMFVTATSQAYPDHTTILTSYPSTRWPSERLHSVKIWEAARATSAASTFFDPVAIGADKEVFLDGATGANNPVRQVTREAHDVWSFRNLADDLQCFVSIGTGVPSVEAFGNTPKSVFQTLKNMSTETEKTAEEFLQEHSDLDEDHRLFRFNVERGLEKIGLEESKKQHLIASATYRYLAQQRPLKELKYCVETLKLRQWISFSSAVAQDARRERHQVLALLDKQVENIVSGNEWPLAWFVNFPEYQAWFSGTSDRCLCYLYPSGTGKTTILSRLVRTKQVSGTAHLPTFAYVDMGSYDPSDFAGSHIKALQSILYQFIDMAPGRLSPLLHLLISLRATPSTALSTLTILQASIGWLARQNMECLMYIICDGIDTIQPSKDLVGSLVDIFFPCHYFPENVRVLFAGCPAPEIVAKLERFPTVSEETELDHCGNSLYFQEWQDRKSLVKPPFPNTAEWVWKHESFLDWSTSFNILWIKGKAGSGKSTIARMIADRFQRSTTQNSVPSQGFGVKDDTLIADFFYSEHMGEKATCHYYMLRSVLFQLLRSDRGLYQYFQPRYRKLFDSGQKYIRWSMVDLQSVFQDIVKGHASQDRKVVCIVDAFDESEGSHTDQNHTEYISASGIIENAPDFLQWLCSMAHEHFSAHAPFRLIILSRPQNSITKQLGSFPSITVEKHNDPDIDVIIDDGLEKLRKEVGHWAKLDGLPQAGSSGSIKQDPEWKIRINEVFERLRMRMRDRADHTIQWVITVLQELKDQIARESISNIKDLESTLETLPKGLSELWQELVKRLTHRLSPKQLERARSMLTWACFMERPLSLAEFRDALAITGWRPQPQDTNQNRSFQNHLNNNRFYLMQPRNWQPFERDIMDKCGCMLEVVRPASAQDNCSMADSDGSGFCVQVSHQTIKDFLVRSSETDLCRDPNQDWKLADSHPLALKKTPAKSQVADELAAYIISSIPMPDWSGPQSVELWSSEHFRTLANHIEDRPLLDYIIGYFWRCHCDPRQAETMAKFSTYLQTQISKENHGWCLLEGWLPFRGPIGGSATVLSSICTPKIDDASLKLLKGWMTFKASANKIGTWFSPSVSYGGSSETLVSPWNLALPYQPPNLSFAQSSSAAEASLMCQVLPKSMTLAQTPPVTIPRPSFEKIIPGLFLAACELGCHSVIRLVLEHFELQTSNFTKGFCGALHADPLTKYLLLSGNSHFVMCSEVEDELFSLAAENNYQAVELLLDLGAEVNNYNEFNIEHHPETPLLNAWGSRWTPLHCAAAGGSKQAATILLRRGARELPGQSQETPLMLAARGAHAETVEVLLSFDASVARKDNNGKTALALAMEYADERTIRCLLNAGSDIEAVDDNGVSVVDLAIQRSNKYPKSKTTNAIMALLAAYDKETGHFGLRRNTTPLQSNNLIERRERHKTGLFTARDFLCRHPSYPGHADAMPPYINFGFVFRHRYGQSRGNPYMYEGGITSTVSSEKGSLEMADLEQGASVSGAMPDLTDDQGEETSSPDSYSSCSEIIREVHTPLGHKRRTMLYGDAVEIA